MSRARFKEGTEKRTDAQSVNGAKLQILFPQFLIL